MPGQPWNEPPKVLTVTEVHDEFNRLLRDRREMGLRNLVAGVLLEPRNPFQKIKRKPQRWAVATGGLMLLALLISAYFHGR